MLTKDCRSVLDTVIQMDGDRPFQRHRIAAISEKMGKTFELTLSICKELERDGFVEIKYLSSRVHAAMPESIVLTEKGRCYKAFLRSQTFDYLKQKWIDFLALVVAAIALAISIAAYIRTGSG